MNGSVIDAKLLVVEDDVFFQRVLQKRLESEGYRVMVADNGREGMKAIVGWEPDLVLSDWMMPEVDGLELCQSVKAGLREAAPYFILLTAKGEMSDKLLGLQTGADDYLVKPCDHSELLARVRSGLRIVRLTQQLRGTVGELQMANAELSSTRDTLDRIRVGVKICRFCRRLKDDDGEWMDLDHYLLRRSERAACPECQASSESILGDGTSG